MLAITTDRIILSGFACFHGANVRTDDMGLNDITRFPIGARDNGNNNNWLAINKGRAGIDNARACFSGFAFHVET